VKLQNEETTRIDAPGDNLPPSLSRSGSSRQTQQRTTWLWWSSLHHDQQSLKQQRLGLQQGY
jgi:hypothetical protein